MKQSDNQIKEQREQFAEQIKFLETKLSAENSILNSTNEFYKRRAVIEQEYSLSLLRLCGQISQKNKDQKQPWKNGSAQNVLTSLLASTQNTARTHRNLSDVYGKQMTQRIADMQDDNTRLARKSIIILQKHQAVLLKSLQNTQEKQRLYLRAFTDTDDARKKAARIVENLDKEVVKIQDKKIDVEKNRKIKKLLEDYREKEKSYNEKLVECTRNRNKYIIHVASVRETMQDFCSNILKTLVQTSEYSLHNNLTRLSMCHASSEEALQNQHESVNKLMIATVEKFIEFKSDIKLYTNEYSHIFESKEKIAFPLAKGDSIDYVLKKGNGLENSMSKIYEDLSNEFKKSTEVVEGLMLEVEKASEKLIELINQSDFDVIDYIYDTSSSSGGGSWDGGSFDNKVGSLNRCVTPDYNLYTGVQRQVKDDKLKQEAKYLEVLENYLMNDMICKNVKAKIDKIEKAIVYSENNSRNDWWMGDCNSGTQTTSGSSTSPTFPSNNLGVSFVIQPQTAILIGKRPRLFGGDLNRYCEELGELVPMVVRSCIRLIRKYGMKNVGVFRVPGSQTDVQQYKSYFEFGVDHLVKLEGNSNDVNLAASILKLYFREIESPIFSVEFFSKILNEYENIKSSDKKMIEFLEDLVQSFQLPVYATTKYVLSFLNHLVEYSSDNCMDVMNLAIIFGPCLIPIPEEYKNQIFQHQTLVNRITECLITNVESIFTSKKLPQVSSNNLDDIEYQRLDTSTAADIESTGYHSSDLDNKNQMKNVEDGSVAVPRLNTEIEAFAIAEYIAREKEELNLSPGTELILKSKLNEHWWLGSLKHSDVEGHIPAIYIKIKEPQQRRESDSDKDENDIKLRNFKERKKSLISLESLGASLDEEIDLDLSQNNLTSSTEDQLGEEISSPVPLSASLETEQSISDNIIVQDDLLRKTVNHLNEIEQLNIKKNRNTVHIDKSVLTRSKFISPFSLDRLESNINHLKEHISNQTQKDSSLSGSTSSMNQVNRENRIGFDKGIYSSFSGKINSEDSCSLNEFLESSSTITKYSTLSNPNSNPKPNDSTEFLIKKPSSIMNMVSTFEMKSGIPPSVAPKPNRFLLDQKNRKK